MTSKTTNLLYWIFTILFAGLMTLSAIPNVLNTPETKQFMHDMLGYPVYIIPFIGFAKLAGSIVILIPGLKKIKEWAYAGFAFVFLGAIWTHIATGTPWIAPFIALLILLVSYGFRLRLKAGTATI